MYMNLDKGHRVSYILCHDIDWKICNSAQLKNNPEISDGGVQCSNRHQDTQTILGEIFEEESSRNIAISSPVICRLVEVY